MLPEYIEALLDPSAYPEPPDRVEVVQTHISYVLIAGEHVYKIKKAVDLGFLDFSSLELRKHFCEEEVRLNSRLCRALYFGVETVVRGPRGFQIGRVGEVVEYAVHMRRLPAERMMDVLLQEDAVSLEMIGRLAERIVRFHARAPSGPAITRVGGFAAFAGHWLDNFEQIRPFVGKTIGKRRFERLSAFARSTLAREEGLLRQREKEGRVRDGHGDLRCESVCFDFPRPGGVCISDCIEFGEAYRVGDTGLDIGFLAMDLEARGRPDLADLLIGLFCAASGDGELPLALRAFKSYRAIVRGKVNSFVAVDAGVTAKERARARRDAAVYFRLAESYSRRRTGPFLILVRGLTGSGKSVLAGALASRLSAALIATDVTRKQMTGRQPTRHARAEVNAGIYRPETTEMVYERLAEEGRRQIALGRSAVLDGTYLRRHQRSEVLTAAAGAKIGTLIVDCWAPEDVIEARQRARVSETWTTSDAGWEVYLAQKAMEEPVAGEEGRSVRVDTTTSLAAQLAAVEATLR